MDIKPESTAAEVAAALKVSRPQIYALARERKIPCYRVGGAIRFDMAQVLAAMERPAEAPRPKQPAVAIAPPVIPRRAILGGDGYQHLPPPPASSAYEHLRFNTKSVPPVVTRDTTQRPRKPSR